MKTQITPNFENIATPGAIVRQLEGRTMPELIALFRRAESACSGPSRSPIPAQADH